MQDIFKNTWKHVSTLHYICTATCNKLEVIHIEKHDFFHLSGKTNLALKNITVRKTKQKIYDTFSENSKSFLAMTVKIHL